MKQQGSILQLLLIVVVATLGVYLYIGRESGQSLINQINSLLSIETKPQSIETEVLPTSVAQITITKDGFLPATIAVAKNQQVIWVNQDRANHHVTVQNLDLDSDSLSPTDSFAFTFEEEGTYTYHNGLSSAKGVIIVR